MKHLRALTLCAAAIALPTAAAADDGTRQLVTLPEPMRQHMLANMRDHLAAVNEIQQLLGSGAFQRAADVAEKRLGLSSLERHGASHMAPFMPKAMQDNALDMWIVVMREGVATVSPDELRGAVRQSGAAAEVE